MSPGEAWQAVKQFRKDDKFDKALELLGELCGRFPKEFRYLLCMGELLVQEGRLEEAEPFLRQAKALGPPDEKTSEVLDRLDLRRRLLLLEQAGRPKDVIGLYHQVVRDNPSLVRRIEDWTPIVNRAGQTIYQANGEHVGDKVRQIIEEVRQRGIAFSSFDEIVGEPELFRELQEVARTTKDWTVPGKPHFFKAIREEEASAAHPILKAALHPRLLEVANAFYGLYTRLVSANVVLTKTDPTPERMRQGSEGWHRDPEDTPMFKIFIYLNDVLEVGHGPFQYVPESRPGQKYEYLMPRFGRGVYDPTYKTKPDWAQAARDIDQNDVVTVLGKAGTMFFCDTSAFHRGGYCTAQDRFMAANVYQRPGSQFPSYIQMQVDDSSPVAVRMAVTPP